MMDLRLVVSVALVLLSAVQVRCENDVGLYDVVKRAQTVAHNMRASVNELRDRFILLRTLSNFTLPLRLMDIENNIVDMQVQNLDWDLAEITWTHAELMHSNFALTDLVADIIMSCEALGSCVQTLKNDLLQLKVVNVAIDLQNVTEFLTSTTGVYWKTIENFDKTVKRINSVVANAFEDKPENSYTSEINKQLQVILERLENERNSIGNSKLRLDEYGIKISESASKVVAYISPFPEV